jgi:DME family drug/metabolite transporter
MRRATLLVLGAAFLWGTTFPATTWGLTSGGWAPVSFLLYRYAIGTAAMLAIALARRSLHGSYFADWRLWALGTVNALGYVLQYAGQSITTASKTSLLVNVNVLLTALLAAWLLHERIQRGVWFGLALGTIGVALLTTGGVFTVLSDQFWGDALAFGTGISWTILILGYKAYMNRHPQADPVGMNIVVFAVTLLCFLVAALVRGEWMYPANAGGTLLVVYLGVLPTTVAFLMWQEGLRALSAAVSSILLLFETIVALVLSILVLSERLTGWSAAGALLIMAAMYLASRAPTAGPTPTVAPEAQA